MTKKKIMSIQTKSVHFIILAVIQTSQQLLILLNKQLLIMVNFIKFNAFFSMTSK